jgi:hypothetical protein
MANPIETIEVENRESGGKYYGIWRLTTRNGDKSYDISKVDQKESLKDKRIARIELYWSKYCTNYIQGMQFYDWKGALLFKIGSFDNYHNNTTVQLRRGEQLVGINNKSGCLENLTFIIARP